MWGGRWEGGSCLGTHVRIKYFKIKKKFFKEIIVENFPKIEKKMVKSPTQDKPKEKQTKTQTN